MKSSIIFQNIYIIRIMQDGNEGGGGRGKQPNKKKQKTGKKGSQMPGFVSRPENGGTNEMNLSRDTKNNTQKSLQPGTGESKNLYQDESMEVHKKKDAKPHRPPLSELKEEEQNSDASSNQQSSFDDYVEGDGGHNDSVNQSNAQLMESKKKHKKRAKKASNNKNEDSGSGDEPNHREGFESNDEDEEERNSEEQQNDSDDEDDDDDEDDMNSHVVSQHPLSSDGNVDHDGAHQNEQGQRIITEEESFDLDDEGVNRVNDFQATRKDMVPLILYKVAYLGVVVVPPIIFAGESMVTDCKNSPHYISHAIFLVLQIILVALSTYQHKKVAGLKHQQKYGAQGVDPLAGTGSGLIKSQGRCCRELLSQMKLADTYTNMCFIGILLNFYFQQLNHTEVKDEESERSQTIEKEVPMYMFLVSLASIGVYLLIKVALILYFVIFTCRELVKIEAPQTKTTSDNEANSRQVDRMASDIKAHIEKTQIRSRIQKSLVHLLLWLDLEAFAKLYDGEERSEAVDYQRHKTRYAFLKIFIEDFPLCAMEALFLQQGICQEGLNTIIILSLYFNGICVLYALSNLCSQGHSKDKNKIYKKELDRLKDYYDAGNTQVRVVAEFYIEDSLEVQAIKMQALNDFLADNSNDVNNFNFSTNQMGVKTINSLNDILRNCADSLSELTLSRCRLSSSHINTLMFSVPKNTFQMLGSLTKLNLSENRINDKGAAIISNYIIQYNKDSLLSLNMEQNFLTLSGAKSILEALRSSRSLFQIHLKRNKLPPVNGPHPQENASVCMLIFEMLKMCQVNYVRYVREKLQSGMSQTQNRQRPIEQFLVKLSSSNEAFDKVLCQMFKIDAFQQTVRTLDLSLRFFKGSQKNVSPRKKYVKDVPLTKPDFIESEESKKHFSFYKGMKSYDDEQRLILMSLHYNSNLKETLLKNYGLELSVQGRSSGQQSQQQLQLAALPSYQTNQASGPQPPVHPDLNIFYLANSVMVLNLSSDWFPCKSRHGSPSPQSLIFETISRFENLHEILFNNNSIKGHNGGAEFYNALAACSNNLSAIRIKSCQYSQNVNAQVFERAFKECFTLLTHLKVLNLSYSNLTDPLINGLAECIGNMPAIVKINLKQCGLTHKSVDKILEHLSLATGKSTLASLNLSGNSLQGLSHMGKFLAKSNCSGSLEHLKMSNCKLGDLELKQLSRGLMISRTLRVLDLSQNQITNVGYIKEGIQSNIALEKLDLSSNQIDNEGLGNLTEALSYNRSIETLAIAFNKYTLSGLKKLFTTLFQHTVASPMIEEISPPKFGSDVQQEEEIEEGDSELSTIANLSFSIPKFDRENDYTEMCNLLLKTLITTDSDQLPHLKQRPREDEDDSDSNGGDSEDDNEDQFTDDEEERKKGKAKQHRFRRLEILGDKVKKLRNPTDFFFKFFRDGCANVEEIIIDSILKKEQLNDMVRGLFAILQPQKNKQKEEEKAATGQKQVQQQRVNNSLLTKKDMRRIAKHKLERVTFIKPQEYSEEIQMLETLLDQKLNIAATYNQRKYHYLQQKKGQKINQRGQNNQGLRQNNQTAANQLFMLGQVADSNGMDFGDDVRYDRGDEMRQVSKRNPRSNLNNPYDNEPIDTSGEGNLDSQVLEESIMTQRGARKEGAGIGDIETKLKQKTTIQDGLGLTKGKTFAKGVKLPADALAAADLMPIQDDDSAPVDLDDVRMNMQSAQHQQNHEEQYYEYEQQQQYDDDYQQQQYDYEQQYYGNQDYGAEESKEDQQY